MERLLAQRYYYTAAPIEQANKLMNTGIEPGSIELTRDKKEAADKAARAGVQHGRMAIIRINPAFLEKKHMTMGRGSRTYRGSIDPHALIIMQIV